MNFLNILGSIFEPATKLIDELHTSPEEMMEAKRKLMKIQMDAFNQAELYERELLNAKAKIIEAEAMGSSWIQRNWRPITMLTFLALVVADSFGWLAFRLAEEAWTLLQIGLGGYVVGRSAEKIAPTVKGIMGK